MATVRCSLPHEDRTANEPREANLEPVVLSHLREINSSIRILRLSAVDPGHTISFLPGQWLDTYIPGLPKAGGFTITSTPYEARPTNHSAPYLELAVQKSTNPPAQWLWQPQDEILGTQLVVRVGGSFTWPPPHLDVSQINRLVLIAGGVGINPLISIFSTLTRSPSRPREIHFLYGTKADADSDPQRVLFLSRLMDLITAFNDPNVTLSLFLTSIGDGGRIEHGKYPICTFARRIAEEHLIRALDGHQGEIGGAEPARGGTVCYVCGPAVMTDSFVNFLAGQPGMAEERVLCEKWW